MLRTSDAPRLFSCLLVVAACALAGCGPQGAKVTIALAEAPGEVVDGVGALRVNVRQLNLNDPQRFEPYDIDPENPPTLETDVPPGEPFYVDIWGCPSSDRCGAVDVIARGCTDVITVPEGRRDYGVTVFMYNETADSGAPSPPT